MTTIESILKHAEQIGKEPGKPQDQRMINNIKIGMRVAIAECQRWIPVDEELPPIDEDYKITMHSITVIVKSVNYNHTISSYNYKLKRWMCAFPEQVTHWRPIDLK